MSRSQQNQVFNTTQQNAATLEQGGQQGVTAAQKDIGTFQGQLAKFQAANPFVQGGEYQTAQNAALTGTAAGTAQAAKQNVESAAVRTGQNVGGSVAAGEEMQQASQRELGTEEAQANQSRIGQEAGYNENALKGYQTAETMQDQLAQQQLQAAQGQTGTEEQAANTPSFSDMLGQQLIKGLGATMKVGGATLGV